MVLARRSFEVSRAAESSDTGVESNNPSKTPSLSRDGSSQTFSSLAHRYALSTSQIFLQMPENLAQELPKFHHVCIAYCALVLAEYDEECSRVGMGEVLEVLEALRSHYSQFSEEIPAAMNFAVEKAMLSVKNKGYSVGDGTKSMPGNGWTTPQRFTNEAAGQGEKGNSHNQVSNSFEPDNYHDATTQELDDLNFGDGLQFPAFVTVEDFFSGVYSDLGSDYHYNG